MKPSTPTDFNFDSTSTSPFISAPSSPQRFGTFFFSAPTSPARVSSFYAEFNNFCSNPAEADHDSSLSSAVPFNWEEKPGIPKAREFLTSPSNDYEDIDDFAFDFSGPLQMSSISAADELFDGGKIKIKPLKPPPGLAATSETLSPKSPRSPTEKIKDALSPRRRKKEFDPFAAALEQTRRESIDTTTTSSTAQEKQRGRERIQNSSSIRQKGTRSLSPVDSSSSTSPFSSFWYRKWKLKDLLLFRSASEGRPTGKGQLKKYSVLKKSDQEEVKNSSFRSTDSVGSSVSSSKRRGRVSAHELHYTENRAFSQELKKKTLLPYKQGLLGCLGFNPGIPIHEISKLGSMSRARD